MQGITGSAVFDLLLRLDVEREQLVLTIATKAISASCIDSCTLQPQADGTTRILVPTSLPLRGGTRAITVGQKTPQPDASLVSALRRAHAMLDKASDGHPTIGAAPASWYDRRVLRLAFLAPRLQHSILAGTQPRHVNLEFLVRSEIPLAWAAQGPALRWSE
jgi:hypothetical protein